MGIFSEPVQSETENAATMREVEWAAPLLEKHVDAARSSRIKSRYGRAGSPLPYFMASDWMPEANEELNVTLFTRTHLSHELADLVGLSVTRENSCRYCFAATRALLIAVGYSRKKVSRLEQNLAVADLDDKTLAAIDFAQRLSRCNPHPTRKDVEALERAGIDGIAYRELAASVSIWMYFVRVSTIAALPPEFMEELPDRFVSRLIRPLIGGVIDRRFRTRGRAVALPAEMRSGACAEAINALDGLPQAIALRRAIDAMWDSDGLPRRTRALMCVTVARALGCPSSEAEACSLLEQEGVPAETVNGVLSHLDAPGLTDDERMLVHFARETVWYEPAPLQRRAAEVRSRLSEREFVESIATVAMANMLCRLHIALGLADDLGDDVAVGDRVAAPMSRTGSDKPSDKFSGASSGSGPTRA